MARILQTDVGKGIKPTPSAFEAGDTKTVKSEYVASAVALASTDIIEMAILPAGCAITDFRLCTEGTWTGITADVGIMTGDVGSTATDRTVGTELFNDVDLTVASSAPVATNAAAFLLDPVDYDRSIGLAPSGVVAAASTKKLTLVLEYAAMAPTV